MAKRVLKILIIWLSLFFPGLTWGALHYYSGTMNSTFVMNHTYTILVPEGLTSLTYLIAIPEEYALPNSVQDITGLNLTCSVTPSTEDYVDTYESHYKKLIWTNPSKGTITITLNYTVSSGSDWSILMPDDEFPFDSSGLPESVVQFLQPSNEVQSDNPVFVDLVDTLTAGLTTQREVLAALNGWIIDNIYYGDNPDGIDALSTYNLKEGSCSNYAHIALALVRAAGIPARLVHGYSLSKSYILPAATDPVYVNWGQGTHAWIEVYYPSMGWIPYDPQRDLHHVDTHRVLWGRGADTTGAVSKVSYDFDSAPSEYPRLYHSLYINWINDYVALSYIKSTDEITDLALSSAVPLVGDHIITSSGGIGGTILPGGEVGVNDGSSEIFNITPRYGYKIEDVTVDGVSKGAISSYTFDNVTTDHTITVEFTPPKSDDSGSSCFIDTIR